VLEEGFRPSPATAPVFEAVGMRPDGVYATADVIVAANSYIEAHDLGERARGGGQVLLDTVLCDAIFKVPDWNEVPMCGCQIGSRRPIWGWVSGHWLVIQMQRFNHKPEPRTATQALQELGKFLFPPCLCIPVHPCVHLPIHPSVFKSVTVYKSDTDLGVMALGLHCAWHGLLFRHKRPI
jgi:hypothetical protein